MEFFFAVLVALFTFAVLVFAFSVLLKRGINTLNGLLLEAKQEILRLEDLQEGSERDVHMLRQANSWWKEDLQDSETLREMERYEAKEEKKRLLFEISEMRSQLLCEEENARLIMRADWGIRCDKPEYVRAVSKEEFVLLGKLLEEIDRIHQNIREKNAEMHEKNERYFHEHLSLFGVAPPMDEEEEQWSETIEGYTKIALEGIDHMKEKAYRGELEFPLEEISLDGVLYDPELGMERTRRDDSLSALEIEERKERARRDTHDWDSWGEFHPDRGHPEDPEGDDDLPF